MRDQERRIESFRSQVTTQSESVSWESKSEELRTRSIFVVHRQRLEVRETSDVKYEIDDTVSYHAEGDHRPGTKGLRQLLPSSHFHPLCAVTVSVTGPIDQSEPINRFVL